MEAPLWRRSISTQILPGTSSLPPRRCWGCDRRIPRARFPTARYWSPAAGTGRTILLPQKYTTWKEEAVSC